MKKTIHCLLLMFLLLSPLAASSQSAEQTVRDCIAVLNNYLLSPNSPTKRSALESNLKGCLIQDGIYIKYKGDDNIDDCFGERYAGIISDAINAANSTWAKVEIDRSLQTVKNGDTYIVTVYLRFSGAIQLNTVTDFHVKNGKKVAMVNNFIKTKEWNNMSAPFSITSCSVANGDYDGNILPFDAEHSQYVSPTLVCFCKNPGTYDIYTKFYYADGKLQSFDSSPTGYSYKNTVSLKSGINTITLSGYGSSTSGWHKASDNYRFEFYWQGTLLYTYRYSMPQGNTSFAPFTITSCNVRNWSRDATAEYSPINSSNTRILWAWVNFSVQRAGNYEILCKLFTPTQTFSETKTVELQSGEKGLYLYGCGTDTPGNHPVGSYRFEFYYNGNLLYTHRFSIPKGQTLIDRDEYVDLGLPSGTLWATCNVGANNPWESGYYYAWGETTTKSYYAWSTYKYCVYKRSNNKDSTKLTKYCSSSYYGNMDFKLTLENSDDAAYFHNIGQIPTKAQWSELINKCTWKWTSQNGVVGFEVKGHNGNTIFLPASGAKHYSSYVKESGTYGFYWSSSLDSNEPWRGHSVNFAAGGAYLTSAHRCIGRPIRPVRKK